MKFNQVSVNQPSKISQRRNLGFLKSSIILSFALLSHAVFGEELLNVQRTEQGKGEAKNTQIKKATNPKSGKKEKKIEKVSGYIAEMKQAALEGRYPAPIGAMIKNGKNVKVLDVFDASSGLIGFVLRAANGEKRIYYATPDGKTVIYGLAFNENLENLTNVHLAQFTNTLAPSLGVGTLLKSDEKPNAIEPEKNSKIKDIDNQDLWSNSDSGAFKNQIEDVSKTTPGVVLQESKNTMSKAFELATKAQGMLVEGAGLPVYIVFDPACPFCHKAYKDTRSLLGQLKIHWIPVGALSPRSSLLAERFLRSADKNAAMVASLSRELEPMESLSMEAATLLNSNLKILNEAGAASVPLVLFSDQGISRQFVGAPSALQIQDLLRVANRNIGPKK